MRRHPLLVLEAALALLLAVAAVRFLPFAALLRLADWRRGEKLDVARADLLARAVQAAARRIPFRCVCLQKGLALHWLLRRRGLASVLHYGVRSGAKLEAHVWITLGNAVILGGPEAEQFTCLLTRPASA